MKSSHSKESAAESISWGQVEQNLRKAVGSDDSSAGSNAKKSVRRSSSSRNSCQPADRNANCDVEMRSSKLSRNRSNRQTGTGKQPSESGKQGSIGAQTSRQTTTDNSTSGGTATLQNSSNTGMGTTKSGEEIGKQKTDKIPDKFEFTSDFYPFTQLLNQYKMHYKDYPQLLCDRTKYFIETEKKGVGCLDLLFTEFCNNWNMVKVKHLPMEGGERVFCWLGKQKSNVVLPHLRTDHHFVNRLPKDVYLKDKQSMAYTLREHVMQRGVSYPPHWCPFEDKEIKLQILCDHGYGKHQFVQCNDANCKQQLLKVARTKYGAIELHEGTWCTCFKSKYFVPETLVFSSLLKQNSFVSSAEEFAPKAAWIVKPSYMRGGKGVRVMADVKQLRDFFKLERDRRYLWGQDYAVQRYISDPLLRTDSNDSKRKFKFDLRMFLLVVVCRFKRVFGFLHAGYVRKVPEPYEFPKPREHPDGEKRVPASQHLASTRLWMNKMRRAINKDELEDECIEYNNAVKDFLKKYNLPSLDKKSMPEFRRRPRTDRKQHSVTEHPDGSFHESGEFGLALQIMINNICSAIFGNIKDWSHCYQVFSLDICVDSNCKPWLLEVNPTIITEDVNWSSQSLRKVVPSVLVEALSLVVECTRKSLNFMPMRNLFLGEGGKKKKQRDLHFRHNFQWWYASPRTTSDIGQMRMLKFRQEENEKLKQTSVGKKYLPKDYYPKKNKAFGLKPGEPVPVLKYPTPIAREPVIKEDIDCSLRYTRLKPGVITRQTQVRRQEQRVKKFREKQLEEDKLRQQRQSRKRTEQSETLHRFFFS